MSIVNIVIIAVVYILGVFAALVMIAWLNSDRDGVPMNEGMAACSWVLFVLFIILAIAYYVSRPFNWFYEAIKAHFQK